MAREITLYNLVCYVHDFLRLAAELPRDLPKQDEADHADDAKGQKPQQDRGSNRGLFYRGGACARILGERCQIAEMLIDVIAHSG